MLSEEVSPAANGYFCSILFFKFDTNFLAELDTSPASPV